MKLFQKLLTILSFSSLAGKTILCFIFLCTISQHLVTLWLHKIHPSLNLLSFHTVMLFLVCKGEEQLTNTFIFPLTIVLVWLSQGLHSLQVEREISRQLFLRIGSGWDGDNFPQQPSQCCSFYLQTNDTMSSNKSQEKEVREGIFIIKTSVFQNNHYAY